MKLGKPPIVQAWIEFRFDHADDRSDWGLPTSLPFLDRLQNDYPERETMSQMRFKIQKLDKHQKSQVIDEQVQLEGIRCFNSNRSRSVQLTRNTLACNFLRTNEMGYEGFAALKAESLAKLQDYCECFRPIKMQQFAVQYVDLVRIPFVNNNIELKEYFTFGHDLEESVFGPTLSFLVQYTSRPPNSEDELEVRLWNEPPDPEGPIGQFRMEWRLMGYDRLSLEESVLGPRLDQAHSQLLDCFRKSFTTKAWAAFEPNE